LSPKQTPIAREKALKRYLQTTALRADEPTNSEAEHAFPMPSNIEHELQAKVAQPLPLQRV
jgi:hypothetical protein